MRVYGCRRYDFCCPGHASEVTKYSGTYNHHRHDPRGLYLRNKGLKHRARQQGRREIARQQKDAHRV